MLLGYTLMGAHFPFRCLDKVYNYIPTVPPTFVEAKQVFSINWRMGIRQSA